MEVIGKGTYGLVRGNARYAYKRYKTAGAPEEAKIAEEMGRKGIGPKVYNVRMDGEYTIIRMQKLHGTVANMVPSAQELSDIQALIKKAQSSGVKHGDIHIENIMYNINSNGNKRFYLIDFGRATHTNAVSNNNYQFRKMNLHMKRRSEKAPRRLGPNSKPVRGALF